MKYADDTIAAISTPVGPGGIGIVRISGSGSLDVAARIFRPKRNKPVSSADSFSVMYGHIIRPDDGSIVDEVLVTMMRAPSSYTKEDVVEVSCHGGMVTVREVLGMVLQEGVRLADPGEFTKRAFLNGRISLAQAEAVLDLIRATTEESMKIAAEQLRGGLSEKLDQLRNGLIEICASVEAQIDFPEDEIETQTVGLLDEQLREIAGGVEKLSATFDEARFFREGLAVAIAGRPNVGKSSLLNALLRKDRAIVTPVPGTTRDVIEEYLNINGLPVRIIDTAGIRDAVDEVEREGVTRSLHAMENADFIIVMLDGSEPLTGEDLSLLEKIKNKNAIIAVNKADLPRRLSPDSLHAPAKQCIHISAMTGEGLEELKSALLQSNLRNWREEREGVVVSNIRHKIALDNAEAAIKRASEILVDGRPLEIVAIELRDAMESIGEITGAVTTEDILDKIFSNFCIGK
jgi:tRNA modification GTPase